MQRIGLQAPLFQKTLSESVCAARKSIQDLEQLTAEAKLEISAGNWDALFMTLKICAQEVTHAASIVQAIRSYQECQ